METYNYYFTDGTASAVEVSEEWLAILTATDKREKNNNRRHTRRHISLDYMNTFDLDAEAEGSDPYETLLKKEDENNVRKAVNLLSEKQRELVEKVFFAEKSLREIARETGISHQALSKQMAVIYKNLRKFL
jgi:RNA polymerase sigma factor (sigma-70 family)